MVNFTDDKYIAGIRAGDRAAIEGLYRSMMPSIQRMIQPYQGTEDDAKDLFQDAVVLLYKKLQQPDFKLTSALTTYFYGVCRNLWGNRLQKKSNRHVTLGDDAKYTLETGPDWHEMEEQTLRTRLFQRAFVQLGKDCQQLLQLFFQQKSMEEIMHEMQLGSYDYARRRKYLCKEKLTELIKKDPAYKELNG